MRAVVTTPHLHLSEAPQPEPAAHQALVRVEAFSLNAGEVRAALAATDTYVPGWDFAGVLEEPAANGSTPSKGTRVYGFVPAGAWAEYVVCDATGMAVIPNSVTNAQAAALPVAGVTALAGLESAGTLLGRRVLVTGAAGGVGRFACQLANLAGAEVIAISRRPDLPKQLAADGVATATVFPTIAAAKEAGPYDVILDGVGGDSLATALTTIAPGGLCVTFGNGSGQPTTFDTREFYYTAGARLQGLWLGNFMASGTDCGPMLRRLVELVRQGRLHPPLDAVLPWTSIGEAAERLVGQHVDGKIVLEL